MQRLAIALGFFAAACSSAPKPTVANPSRGDPALYAKKISLSWALQKAESGTEIFLAITDETGKQVSYSLGTYDGDCKRQMPAADMKAMMGVACTTTAGAVELHVVAHDRDIAVLKLRVDSNASAAPDPLSREQVQHIKVPEGVAVEVGT